MVNEKVISNPDTQTQQSPKNVFSGFTVVPPVELQQNKTVLQQYVNV
jgi:hypothetical protein